MSGLRGLEALGLDADLAKSESDAELGSDTAREVGQRISKARIAAGLSGTDLGNALGLAKDQISKIENGRRKLDIGELTSTARFLGMSVGTLLGQTQRPQMALASRIASGAALGDWAPVHRRARQLLELDDLLTKAVGLIPARPSDGGQDVINSARGLAEELPRSKAAAQAQGKTIASLVRTRLDLGGAKIADVVGIFEQNFGVDINLGSWGTQVDGLCVHSSDVALLMASTDFSEGHWRFTLCHELAHHLFGDPRELIEEGSLEMDSEDFNESRASAFAGNLLVPDSGLVTTLEWLGESKGKISERSTVFLMDHFGVSLAALVYRLNTIDWLSFGAGQELRKIGVTQMVARNPDAAPNGAASMVSQLNRAPERLLRRAIDAARSQQLGLSVIALLLEREDDDELWKLIMGSERVGVSEDWNLLSDATPE